MTLSLGQLEVPRRFIAEIPPVFTYRITELINPESPWWVVTYNEVASKTSAYIFFEVQDSSWLWVLSCNMIEEI